jgi:Uma2 family endonuclease
MSSKRPIAIVVNPQWRHRVKTFADLAAKLGDIPADRILVDPPPGQATEEELLRFVEVDHVLCELVDGVLVEKPMGFEESALALWLGFHLRTYLSEHNLGELAGADATLRLAPGLVRLPDIAFILWEHLPEDDEELPSIPDLAPDLAVEILSPSNTSKEMARKRKEYFKAGTTLVWQVFPKSRKVEVYTSPGRCRTLLIDDTLEGGTLLPGFRLPLRTLFGRPTKGSRRRRK